MDAHTLELHVNNFAIRSFRDVGDGDYITARMTYRAKLIPQFFWSGLQAIEKYLKCILVLNRIKAPRTHDIKKLLSTFRGAGEFDLTLSTGTEKFIEHLNSCGPHRYFESSYFSHGDALYELDRAVWEIRRYARVLDYSVESMNGAWINMLQHELTINLDAESSPRAFRIADGALEKILLNSSAPSHASLVWRNAYFGDPKGGKVDPDSGFGCAAFAPLDLYPEILDEVVKFVFLPKDVIAAYRTQFTVTAPAPAPATHSP